MAEAESEATVKARTEVFDVASASVPSSTLPSNPGNEEKAEEEEEEEGLAAAHHPLLPTNSPPPPPPPPFMT